MNALDQRPAIMRAIVIALMAAVGIGILARPASAYLLNMTTTCTPGQKWDTSRPVKVRVLSDSVFNYLNNRDRTSALVDLLRFDRDIKAVIALYNAIPGSSLVLELGPPIAGPINLGEPENENHGTQTIAIGFTNLVAKSSDTAEAWAPGDPTDGCTRTRAHILFRKDFDWIFGPPDATPVNGRSFYTAAQPDRNFAAGARTFLGILTHEMGHAVGLSHPDNSYAIMAQGFRTWFRSPDHVLRTRLLPDDTAGILALYGRSGATKPLDISATASWYRPASAQIDQCEDEAERAAAAARAVSEATGVPIGKQFPPDVIFKGDYVDLFDELEHARELLRACQDRLNAMQISYCKVSSRGDSWSDRLADKPETLFCGVNSKSGSAYAPVSDRVCPRDQVQLRYALNNHTSLRDVLVKSEVWFSRDTKLNVLDGSDTKSPDIRESTLNAARSATLDRIFRLPSTIASGEELYVFVRAIPHDPQTGASLLNRDIEPWNNAVMLPNPIKVESAVCR